MRRIGLLALIGLFGILLLPPTVAQDQRFAIRFGLTMFEPTSDSVIMGKRNELETAFGAQGVFEWYFANRFGLEASVGFALDADLKSDNDVLTGVSVIPITVGINWHPVRTKTIDWGIGAVGGPILYADFTYVDSGDTSTGTVSTDTDLAYGLQTFLDVGFAKGGRWGMSFGLKWLDSAVEFGREELSVDPLIASVMGKFTF